MTPANFPSKRGTRRRTAAAARPLELSTGTAVEEPLHIRVAEEFLVIRYIALIRAVLINIRYLLAFVSTVFVVTIVAWNSYPFQPRQWMDEAFTGMLVLLGSGIIWVFAQMHRNPILSRITDTGANELGLDFYLRLVTFEAIPVLTCAGLPVPRGRRHVIQADSAEPRRNEIVRAPDIFAVNAAGRAS